MCNLILGMLEKRLDTRKTCSYCLVPLMDWNVIQGKYSLLKRVNRGKAYQSQIKIIIYAVNMRFGFN